VGRVHAAGHWSTDEAVALLRARLPEPLRRALRDQFDWYTCRGAHFHNDAHYTGVLFGAWCLAGPQRDLVFPRAGLRIPCSVGRGVIFDPFEPHAVLERNADRYEAERYVDAAANAFAAFEIELRPEVCSAFGIGVVAADAITLSSERAVHPETGAILST
jgi:hypothetical protein